MEEISGTSGRNYSIQECNSLITLSRSDIPVPRSRREPDRTPRKCSQKNGPPQDHARRNLLHYTVLVWSAVVDVSTRLVVPWFVIGHAVGSGGEMFGLNGLNVPDCSTVRLFGGLAVRESHRPKRLNRLNGLYGHKSGLADRSE